MITVAVVDCGGSDVREIASSLVMMGCLPKVANKPDDVVNACAVILSGNSPVRDATLEMRWSGLDHALEQVILRGHPILAVNTGMLLLTSFDEETGFNGGMDVIPGRIKSLSREVGTSFLGFNCVKQVIRHPIFYGIPDDAHFYFDCDSYVDPDNHGTVAATTEYGIQLGSVLVKDNVVTTMFHPEKSGALGLKMYTNFLKLAGADVDNTIVMRLCEEGSKVLSDEAVLSYS